MLNAIAESPQLFSPKATTRGVNADVPQLSLPAKVAQAVAAAAASSGLASPRHTPRKKRGENPQDSPRPSSPRRRGRMSRNASDASVLSSSTTADTMGGLSGNLSVGATEWSSSSQSHTSSGVSLSSSAVPAHKMRKTLPSRICVAPQWLQQEQWKARRRAQWVA